MFLGAPWAFRAVLRLLVGADYFCADFDLLQIKLDIALKQSLSCKS